MVLDGAWYAMVPDVQNDAGGARWYGIMLEGVGYVLILDGVALYGGNSKWCKFVSFTHPSL